MLNTYKHLLSSLYMFLHITVRMYITFVYTFIYVFVIQVSCYFISLFSDFFLWFIGAAALANGSCSPAFLYLRSFKIPFLLCFFEASCYWSIKVIFQHFCSCFLWYQNLKFGLSSSWNVVAARIAVFLLISSFFSLLCWWRLLFQFFCPE